jgi:hypothetical protein
MALGKMFVDSVVVVVPLSIFGLDAAAAIVVVVVVVVVVERGGRVGEILRVGFLKAGSNFLVVVVFIVDKRRLDPTKFSF